MNVVIFRNAIVVRVLKLIIVAVSCQFHESKRFVLVEVEVRPILNTHSKGAWRMFVILKGSPISVTQEPEESSAPAALARKPGTPSGMPGGVSKRGRFLGLEWS
jgi:hypothetical protein